VSSYLSAFNAFRHGAAKQICKFWQTSAMPLNVFGAPAAAVDEHSMAMAPAYCTDGRANGNFVRSWLQYLRKSIVALRKKL